VVLAQAGDGGGRQDAAQALVPPALAGDGDDPLDVPLVRDGLGRLLSDDAVRRVAEQLRLRVVDHQDVARLRRGRIARPMHDVVPELAEATAPPTIQGDVLLPTLPPLAHLPDLPRRDTGPDAGHHDAPAGDLPLAGHQVPRADVLEHPQQQLQLVRLAHKPVLAMHAWVRQHTGVERPHIPEWRARGW
jgi:hypothetical protein